METIGRLKKVAYCDADSYATDDLHCLYTDITKLSVWCSRAIVGFLLAYSYFMVATIYTIIVGRVLAAFGWFIVKSVPATF